MVYLSHQRLSICSWGTFRMNHVMVLTHNICHISSLSWVASKWQGSYSRFQHWEDALLETACLLNFKWLMGEIGCFNIFIQAINIKCQQRRLLDPSPTKVSGFHSNSLMAFSPWHCPLNFNWIFKLQTGIIKWQGHREHAPVIALNTILQ